MTLWAIFLTGLTTGGLTCLAMQGGLLTGMIANQKEELLDKGKLKNTSGIDKGDWQPVMMFLGSKLVAHIIVGLLLGLLGSLFTLSIPVRVAFQVFAALFMLATAMNLLNVHPIFRHVLLTPPKSIQRLIRRHSKDTSWFSPVTLGALTIFIPCGVTQAIAVLAINSGSASEGALIMGSFVLGTMPLFSLIGIATAKFSEMWRGAFLRLAAYALIVMSLYALNGVLLVLDSPISAQKIYATYQKLQRYENGGQTPITNSGSKSLQKVTINVVRDGYNPKYVQVKAGVPVELTVKNDGVYSCAAAFVFRQFGISTMLKPVDKQSFTFTPPKGSFTFACSMGMYYGIMEAI